MYLSARFIASVAVGLAVTDVSLAFAAERLLTPKEIKEIVAAEERAEHARLSAQLEARRANVETSLNGLTRTQAQTVLASKGQYAPVVPKIKPTLDPCASGGKSIQVLLRRNSQDTFQLGAVPVPLTSAKGASISLTQDNSSHTNAVQINGRVQAIVASQHPLERCKDGRTIEAPGLYSNSIKSGYVIAPFVDAQGTANNPKKSTESSVLQAGIDLQFQFLGGPLPEAQYLILTPYHQTDFRSEASVQGFQAAWDFMDRRLNLGGTSAYENPYFSFFWQARAEYDGKHVSTPGLSGLSQNNYSWLGGTLQAHVTFFPSYGGAIIGRESTSISDRFYLNAMFNFYRDANHGKTINMYELEFGYNLSDDGKSSVSFKYDKGTVKDTVLDTNKYVIGFNYKY